MPRLVIHLFGAVQVLREGVPLTLARRKATALLAYLAIQPRPLTRDEAAGLLWPELDQQGARKMLRQVLTELRRALGASVIVTGHEQIVLAQTPDLWVDVHEFRALHARVLAHHDPADQLCPTCIADLNQATILYTGAFMAGFALGDAADFEAWQARQADSLQQDAVTMLAQLTQAHVYAGQRAYRLAIAYAARWLSLDPASEEAHRTLMRLYAQNGQRSAALNQYETCVAALAAELDVEPDPETVQLAEAIRSGAFPGAALVTPDVPVAWSGDSRPIAITPFVGRERELHQIEARLADPTCRLLTITGPGGIGKTRLALKAAHACRDQFPDGLYFVDLAPVQSPEQFVPRLVAALDAPTNGGTPEQALIDFLRTKRVLVLLDGCEHLVEATGWLGTLLQAAPQLKLLVTSRVRLNLRDEWLETLEGLETPPPTQLDIPATPAPELTGYPASKLFLHCMQRVQPSAAPDAVDATTIVDLCRLVDGMPLAIELAAAWSRTLPLKTILHELTGGLTILNTSLRDMPARHRSMRAVFDQSWQMLSPRERAILRRFSAFRGGCRPEAAHALTDATLENLADLVDKSWLRTTSRGRYAMHDLVRQYCAQRLADEEDAGTVYHRHAAYYGRLLLQILDKMGYEREALDDLLAEFGNLQAGLRWAALAHDTIAMRAMSNSLYCSAEMVGNVREVARLYQSVVDLLEPELEDESDPERWQATALTLAWVLWPYSNLFIFTGHMDQCGAMAMRNRCLLEKVHPCPDRTYLLSQTEWVLALHALRGGYYAEGEARLQAVLKLYTAPDFPSMFFAGHKEALDLEADIYSFTGHGAFHRGDYPEAERRLRRGISIRMGLGERRYHAHHQGWLVRVLQVQGRYAEAEALAHSALAGVIAAGDTTSEMGSRVAIARLELELGRHEVAREHFGRVLALAEQTGVLSYHMDSYGGLGWVELAAGNPDAARAYGDAALAIVARAGPVHSNHYPGVLVMAGWAALAAHDLPAARHHLTAALHTRGRLALDALQALAGLAHVLAEDEEPEAALALLTVVEQHAATPYGLRIQVRQAIQDLRAGVGATLADTPSLDVLSPELREVVELLQRDPGVAPNQEPAPVAPA